MASQSTTSTAPSLAPTSTTHTLVMPSLPFEPTRTLNFFPPPTSTGQNEAGKKSLSQLALEWIFITIIVVIFAVVTVWRIVRLKRANQPLTAFFKRIPPPPPSRRVRAHYNAHSSFSDSSLTPTYTSPLTLPPSFLYQSRHPSSAYDTRMSHSPYPNPMPRRARGSRRVTRGGDIRSGGRRTGRRDVDDLDEDWDDKEELPAYERTTGGLPIYSDVLRDRGQGSSSGGSGDDIGMEDLSGFEELRELTNPEDPWTIYGSLEQVGASAETREATCNAITLSTSDPVTITILPLTRSVSQQYLLNRLKILRQLDHPAFFQFKDCFLVDGNEIREFWIVVERTAGKTLEDILEKRTEPLEENVVAKLAYDMLGALSYLHRHSIVHHQISPTNIFITAGGSLRLTNFIQSRIITSTPEDPSPTDDIRALGHTILYICNQLWDSDSENTDALTGPERWSDGMRSFVETCLAASCSAADLQSNPFLTQPLPSLTSLS